jgi:hypothetical protein
MLQTNEPVVLLYTGFNTTARVSNVNVTTGASYESITEVSTSCILELLKLRD